MCWAIERWLLSNIRFFPSSSCSSMTLFIFSERDDWVFIRKMKLTLCLYTYIYIHLHSVHAFNFSRESVFLSPFFYLIILTYYGCCCGGGDGCCCYYYYYYYYCRLRLSSSHLTLSVLMNREKTTNREREGEKKSSICHPIGYTFIVRIKTSNRTIFLLNKYLFLKKIIRKKRKESIIHTGRNCWFSFIHIYYQHYWRVL